jgi:hypothetical protein
MPSPFTRPEKEEKIEELTTLDIFKLIDKGEPVFCGKCGKGLDTSHGVKNCNECFPLETLTEGHDLNLTIVEDRIIAMVVINEEPECERGNIDHALLMRALRDIFM